MHVEFARRREFLPLENLCGLIRQRGGVSGAKMPTLETVFLEGAVRSLSSDSRSKVQKVKVKGMKHSLWDGKAYDWLILDHTWSPRSGMLEIVVVVWEFRTSSFWAFITTKLLCERDVESSWNSFKLSAVGFAFMQMSWKSNKILDMSPKYMQKRDCITQKKHPINFSFTD